MVATEDLETLQLKGGGQQPVSPGMVPGGGRTPGTPQAVSPGLQQVVAAVPVLPSLQPLGSGGLGVLQTGMGDLGPPVVLQLLPAVPGGQGVLPAEGNAIGPLLGSGAAELLLDDGALGLQPSGLGELEGLPLQEPALEAVELLPALDGAWIGRWVLGAVGLGIIRR